MPEKDHASGVKISRGDELQRSQTRPAAVIKYSMPKSSEFRSSIEQVRFSNGRKKFVDMSSMCERQKTYKEGKHDVELQRAEMTTTLYSARKQFSVLTVNSRLTASPLVPDVCGELQVRHILIMYFFSKNTEMILQKLKC